MTGGYTLYGGPGGGSMIVEALLVACAIPHDVELFAWPDIYHRRAAPLLAVNPVGHVPALVGPTGEVMTETAAIALWLAEQHPTAGLAPPPDTPDRGRFLRLLTMLVATVYPTFTYGDEPSKWVAGDDAAAALKASTDQRRMELWRLVDSMVDAAPWAMGARHTAVDIFLTVMTRWRPGRPWFVTNCPRLAAIAAAGDARPGMEAIYQRNQPTT